jgi:hypothetical protein
MESGTAAPDAINAGSAPSPPLMKKDIIRDAIHTPITITGTAPTAAIAM